MNFDCRKIVNPPGSRGGELVFLNSRTPPYSSLYATSFLSAARGWAREVRQVESLNSRNPPSSSPFHRLEHNICSWDFGGELHLIHLKDHKRYILHFKVRPANRSASYLGALPTLWHRHVTPMAGLQCTSIRWSKSFPTVVSFPISQYTCSYERGQKSCRKTFSRQCDLRSVPQFL